MDFAPWPYFEEDEIQAAVAVLKSGKVNQWTGGEVVAFEKAFSDYIGVKYAIALANGSVALDLALQAYNIGPGDEVIVTPRSFVASASCIGLKGAVPVFVDVDKNSQNITASNIKQAITSKTKAVIAVHLAGWPCELDKIKQICETRNIVLIEDCAQAHGAAYQGKKIGSFGDCSVFSFCQDKILTTGGEGGMLLTDDKTIWEKAWSYKDHGKDYNAMFPLKHGAKFVWAVKDLGTNLRMTEMQAAIGRVMLNKLDGWVEKRREFAALFNQAFDNIPGLRTTIPEKDIYHAYYKYYVFIEPEALKEGWDRTRILESLSSQGIPSSMGTCPEIYLEKVFSTYMYKINGSQMGKTPRRLPVAKQMGETSLMFTVHPTLDVKSIHYVIDKLKTIMEKATR